MNILNLFKNSFLAKTIIILAVMLTVGANFAWGDDETVSTLLSGTTLDDSNNWENGFSNTRDGGIWPSSNWVEATLISKIKYNIESGGKIKIQAEGTYTTTPFLTISYKSDATWNEAKTFTTVLQSGGDGYNNFTELVVDNIPQGSYYLQFKGKAVAIKSIIITKPSAEDVPTLSIFPDEDVDFETVWSDANKVYTITNNTGSAVTISPSIVGSGMFSVSPKDDTEIANGSSQDFTVSFDWEADLAKFGEKTATIYFTPDNDDDPFVISASATATANVVLDENLATTWTSGNGKSVWVKYKPQKGWNTIILPFPTSDNLASIFGSGAVAYRLNSFSDEGMISFSKANTYIGANVPCLVYIENAPDNSSGVLLTETYVYYASNATPGSVSKSNSNSETVTFKGTFAPIAAPGMEGKYGVTTAGKLGKGNSSASIKGFRAYIEADGATSSRLSIVFDDEENQTTDLGFVKLIDKDAKDVFNLQGQKVKKATKGIYIVNGRKVIIK